MTDDPEGESEDLSPGGIVRRYLSLIVDEPISDRSLRTAIDLLGDLYRALDQQPADCFHAIAASLEAKERNRCVTAAALLVVLVHEDTLLPYGPEISTARRVVAECLRGSTPEEQLRALAVLTQHRFPDELVGPMTRLLHLRGSDLSICASLALRRCTPEQLITAHTAEVSTDAKGPPKRVSMADVQEALRLGLEQGVPQILRSNCAAAIFETDSATSPAYAAAHAVLKILDPPFLFAPLMGLYKAGTASSDVIETLEARVRDTAEPVQLRIAMAGALGSVSRDRPDTIATLIRLAHHDRRDILLSMLAGLRQRPIANLEVIGMIVDLLRSGDSDIRLHATWALASASPVPANVLAALAPLLENTDDIDLSAAGAQVLLAADAGAAPTFNAFIESGKPRLAAIVGMAVGAMTPDHVRSWLTAYEADYHWIVDAVLRAAFDKLGTGAELLTPQLREHLEGTFEAVKKDTYLHCIARTRAADAATAQVVARQLLDRSEEVSQLAEAVLLDMGAAAVTPLEDMRQSAPPLLVPRLSFIIQRLAGILAPPTQGSVVSAVAVDFDPALLKQCQDLDDDQLLRMFVTVIDVTKQLDGPASFGQLARELQRKKHAGDIPTELAPSKTILWKKMRRLEGKLGLPLFTNSDNRKGAFTKEAGFLYHAAQLHLRRRL